jgi:hypothetical protein
MSAHSISRLTQNPSVICIFTPSTHPHKRRVHTLERPLLSGRFATLPFGVEGSILCPYQASFYNLIPSIYVLILRALLGDGKPNANPLKVERGCITASSAETSQMRGPVVTGIY